METVEGSDRTVVPAPPGLAATGSPTLELRCAGCGYGAVAAHEIRCPMCGGETWDFAEWRPFSA
jgi:rubrerythrin